MGGLPEEEVLARIISSPHRGILVNDLPILGPFGDVKSSDLIIKRPVSAIQRKAF